MRGVKIHGALLLVTLLWAFQTWSRDEPTATERDRVLVWNRDTAEVVAIGYRSERREVRITRRFEAGDAYLWGVEVVRRVGADSADTLRYPLGAAGERLLADLAELRVLRDLGFLDDARLEELGLSSPGATVTVEFEDDRRVIHLGDVVYGGSDRYAWDPAAGRGLVVPSDVIQPLEIGSGALRERRLHSFRDGDVATVRVESAGRERVMQRVSSGAGAPAAWAPPESPERPDPEFADFMERVSQLAIDGFPPPMDADALEAILRVDYLDERGEPLGFLVLYRDHADPGGDLYLLSERTHVVARAVRLLAERVEQEVPGLF